MTDYPEEQWLLLSGLQHFRFCRRQWALIHIEQQWAENERTVDGTLMHQRAHDRDRKEVRGGAVITRGMSVFSARLGIPGGRPPFGSGRPVAALPGGVQAGSSQAPRCG